MSSAAFILTLLVNYPAAMAQEATTATPTNCSSSCNSPAASMGSAGTGLNLSREIKNAASAEAKPKTPKPLTAVEKMRAELESKYHYNYKGGQRLAQEAQATFKVRGAQSFGGGCCLGAVDESVAHWMPREAQAVTMKDHCGHTRSHTSNLIQGTFASDEVLIDTLRKSPKIFKEVLEPEKNNMELLFKIPGAIVIWHKGDPAGSDGVSEGHVAITGGDGYQYFDARAPFSRGKGDTSSFTQRLNNEAGQKVTIFIPVAP